MNKTCNTCGRVHKEIPETAKVDTMGSWWNCECGSTLMVRVDNWKELLLAEMAE